MIGNLLCIGCIYGIMTLIHFGCIGCGVAFHWISNKYHLHKLHNKN